MPLRASKSSVDSSTASDDIALIGGSKIAHLLDRLDETVRKGTAGWICLRCAPADQHCEVVHGDAPRFKTRDAQREAKSSATTSMSIR